MERKYILQYGNIAGLPYHYSRALQSIGIDSINAISINEEFSNMNRKIPFDRAVTESSDTKLGKQIKRFKYFFNEVADNCSLVHYFGDSILWKQFDVWLLRWMNRPMVISFGGTDVRLASIAQAKNRYVNIPAYSEGEAKIRKKLKFLGKYIRFAATDYELAEYVEPYFEKVFILKQTLDISQIQFNPPSAENRIPVVMHVPTNRIAKGSDFIDAAVERLKSENIPIDYRPLEPVYTQKQMQDIIKDSDIIIDAICTGAYGLSAIEAMSAGKPVICHIRKDLVEKHPDDLPIVSANPDTIYDKLKELVLDSQLRYEIGVKSRAFAEKHHSYSTIGNRLKEIYSEIGLKF
ncbi:MAG: glycosyltransferase [Candidatus Zixiibacteriota bacterium]